MDNGRDFDCQFRSLTAMAMPNSVVNFYPVMDKVFDNVLTEGSIIINSDSIKMILLKFNKKKRKRKNVFTSEAMRLCRGVLCPRFPDVSDDTTQIHLNGHV